MALKLKVRTRLPASLQATSPIAVTKSGLTYTFSWNPSDLASLTSYDTTKKYALVYDPSTGDTNTVQLSALVSANSSAILDGIGSTRGSILYRGSGGWAILAPGTSGYVLTSGGAGADPSYASAASQTVNPQTGTTYTFADGDRSKLVTAFNAGAQAYTLPQAGAASSFLSGWFADLMNKSTNVAGVVTITPTTSTINGAATLKVQPGQSVRIVSDGTNYQIKGLSNASQLPGTTTNDAANAGNVGEFVSSNVASGSAVSLTNATAANVTSISLTAGDWDVFGNIAFSSATSNVTDFYGWISSTSAALPTFPNSGSLVRMALTFSSIGAAQTIPVGMIRISLSGTTTVYLSTQMLFANTASAFGFIGARRVR